MDRSLISAFLSLLGARVATSAISLVALPVVVRLLGDSGYGNYGFLMSTFSLLMILVSSGVTEGVQKFVAESRSDPEWRSHVVGFYLRVALLLGAVGSLLLAAVTATGVVARVLSPPFTAYFYLLAVFVIASQLRAFTRRTMMGLGLERYSEPLKVVRKLVWILLGVALVFRGLGVAAFLLSSIAGEFLFAVVGFAIVLRRLEPSVIFGRRPASFPTRELLSFNGLNIVLVLFFLSLFHVDVMMLRLLTSGAETGLYKAALAIAEYVWFVPLVLQSLLLHSSSALWSDGELDRITSLSARLTRYVLLLTTLMALGLMVLADRFLPLYFGAEFSGAVTPLLLLLPGTLGFALARPLYAVNQGSGRLRPLIAVTSVAALANVVLNALLIPAYGNVGAAMATSVGYGSMFVLQAGCARYLGYDPLADLRAFRVVLTALLTGPAIYLVDGAIPDPLVALAVVPPVGAFVFAVAAVLTGAVDADEIRIATRRLPGPLRSRIDAVLPSEDV
ncbi:MAG: oligosaccharide flippase family protein [Haloarculaceae archaeon]